MVTAQPEGGALDPQGPVSEAMADLFWLMLGLGGAVFVAVVVVLGLGLFRRRPAAEQETGRERPKRFGRWFVVAGVVAPLVILLVVFGATVRAMRLQQAAGVLMWIPAGGIYLVVALALLVTWIRATEREDVAL